MRLGHFSGLLCCALLSVPALAQSCPGGNTLKNDGLPDQASGLVGFSVIPGLCEGEAAAAVLDLPTSGAQELQSVSVGFGANGGVTGNFAVINIEIYDGIAFVGASAFLGPKVFDYANDVGGNLQVTSSGINEIDLSSFGIVVGSAGNTQFVVAARMLINFNGNCTAGFTSNFITDNDQSGLFNCDPAITSPQRNLIDIQGQGWKDASLASISGFPLCPLFYSGNWAIRACGQDVGSTNQLEVLVQTNPVQPGGFASLTFKAPGLAGVPYVAAASFGSSTGIAFASGNPPVVQVFPLNPDPLLFLSFQLPSVFFNFVGLIGTGGTAPGIVFLPNNPVLSGLQMYVAFVALTPAPAPYGVSTAGVISIQ